MLSKLLFTVLSILFLMKTCLFLNPYFISSKDRSIEVLLNYYYQSKLLMSK